MDGKTARAVFFPDTREAALGATNPGWPMQGDIRRGKKARQSGIGGYLPSPPHGEVPHDRFDVLVRILELPGQQ